MNYNETSYLNECNFTTLNNLGNFTDTESYCLHCDSVNLWCGKYDVKRIFELIYLLILILVGVFGNLLVILSIINAGKLYKHGNVFIVNLAIVDLLVSLFITVINSIVNSSLFKIWLFYCYC